MTTLLERGEDGRRSKVRAVSPAFRRKGQLRRQPGYVKFPSFSRGSILVHGSVCV